jgi:hypothetical protein
MGRMAVLVVLMGLLPACVHSWVGRPVTRLEKEMGRPNAIRQEGSNRVYVYPDTLAGRGEMTFTVDSKGIIREWNATNNVQGVFGNDVFGVNDSTTGTIPQNP